MKRRGLSISLYNFFNSNTRGNISFASEIFPLHWVNLIESFLLELVAQIQYSYWFDRPNGKPVDEEYHDIGIIQQLQLK